jgi:hypothetical protein
MIDLDCFGNANGLALGAPFAQLLSVATRELVRAAGVEPAQALRPYGF